MVQVDLSFKEVTGTVHPPCFICGRVETGVPKKRRKRFWAVAGKGLDGKVVCDVCLIISHAMAREKRQKKEVMDGIR